MRTYRLMYLLTGLLSVPLMFLVPISTLILGLLVTVTFGLLLLPISLIWILFLGPLLGLSWLWLNLPMLRAPIAAVGIPIALLAHTYASLMPGMGEPGSRLTKMLLSAVWPYSLPYWRWDVGGVSLDEIDALEFSQALRNEIRGNPRMAAYVEAVDARKRAHEPNQLPDEVQPEIGEETETDEAEAEVVDLMQALKDSVEKSHREGPPKGGD